MLPNSLRFDKRTPHRYLLHIICILKAIIVIIVRKFRVRVFGFSWTIPFEILPPNPQLQECTIKTLTKWIITHNNDQLIWTL